MSKKSKLKFGLIGSSIASATLAILLPSHFARAADAITGFSAGAIGWIVYTLVAIASFVTGIVIVFITYLTGIILQLSNSVVNTLAVQSGFAVTLSVANLGFVLGIIIIAIATILRRETYGIKKTLWKLIVAAILVNFSLVIGGVIINFANTFTTSFMNQLPGAGVNQSGPVEFAKQLAGAFEPQRGYLTDLVNDKSPQNQQSGWTKWIQGAGLALGGPAGYVAASFLTGATSGSDLASIITPIISAILAVGFLIVIVITLATFLIMLLVRYVTLAMLLVLMPFAWLMWIFPKTSHLWSKWWNEFIRWTFFAPIVVFFLWLAIATAQQMNKGLAGSDLAFLNGGQYQAEVGGILGTVSKGFGDFVGTFAVTILQGTIVIGLAIGGMYTANKLSIMGAKTGMGAMTSVGNFAKGYVAKQGKKARTLAYQKAGGERLTRSLREGRIGAGIQKGIQGIPLVGKTRVGEYVAGKVGGAVRRGESLTGRGLASVSTNEELVEKAKKAVPKDTEEIRSNLRGSMNKEDQFAHVAELVKRGELKEDDVINGKTVTDFMDTNGDAIRRFGQGKMSSDADKALGSNKDMRDAAGNVEALKTAGKDTSAAMKDLDDATKKFVEKLEKSDMSKMNVNDVFNKDTDLSRSLARNLAKHGSQLVSSALPKMKSPTLKSFGTVYRSEIRAEQDKGTYAKQVKMVNANATLTAAEKQRVIKKLTMTDEEKILQSAATSFENALANNVLFSGPDSSASAAQATPAAPPPPPSPP